MPIDSLIAMIGETSLIETLEAWVYLFLWKFLGRMGDLLGGYEEVEHGNEGISWSWQGSLEYVKRTFPLGSNNLFRNYGIGILTLHGRCTKHRTWTYILFLRP